MLQIKVVVATRVSQSRFYSDTALGQSLKIYDLPFIEICIFPSNSVGLPELYNSVIESTEDPNTILIFAHDDIFLCDYYWIDQIINGLETFDIVGIAGNTRRIPYQPSWAFTDLRFTWDEPEFLSGVIGHGNTFPPDSLSIFGPPNQKVKLLDGVFIATLSRTCIHNNLRFDTNLQFHFYDLDFCRQAEASQLSCGTIALSMIHQSAGNFTSEDWKAGYQKYIQKWGS